MSEKRTRLVAPASARERIRLTDERRAQLAQLARDRARHLPATPERAEKSPEGWTVVGGAARPKTFLALYGHHLGARHHEAVKVIRDGCELEGRQKLISNRAYLDGSGAGSFTGSVGSKDGHLALSEGERWRLARFQRAWKRFSEHNLEWAWRIRKLVLDEEDEATGKLVTAAALGASRTQYAIGSDSAKAAGVAFVMDALDVFLEADYIISMEARLGQQQRMQELEVTHTKRRLSKEPK